VAAAFQRTTVNLPKITFVYINQLLKLLSVEKRICTARALTRTLTARMQIIEASLPFGFNTLDNYFQIIKAIT